MKPTLALVGRPNVGKSTLFNRLTRTRDALVADMPGLTRDRHYGHGRVGDRAYLVVDTGGFEPRAKEGILKEMAQQAEAAIAESDMLLFIVDGRAGLTPQDEAIGERLRKSGRPLLLVVNKAEGMNQAMVSAEFHQLGLGEPLVISAAHGDGVRDLVEQALAPFPLDAEEADETRGPKVAIVGRPNVGKSTFINAMLGEERVIAFDMPGTTRDAIEVPFERNGRAYTLIDTAGLRRKGKVFEAVEKFSVIKTLQAIEAANVAVLMLDASQDVSDQDAHIAGFIVESGRALVIAVNKWDMVDSYRREQIKLDINRKLNFLGFARLALYLRAERRGHQRRAHLGGQGLCRRHDEADHAQAHARAAECAGKAATAAPWPVPSQDALCPPGRQQSAHHRHSRQCARQYSRVLHKIFGTKFHGSLQTEGYAATHPVQDHQESVCRQIVRPGSGITDENGLKYMDLAAFVG